MLAYKTTEHARRCPEDVHTLTGPQPFSNIRSGAGDWARQTQRTITLESSLIGLSVLVVMIAASVGRYFSLDQIGGQAVA